MLARAVEQGVPAGEAVGLVAAAIDAPRFRRTLEGVAAALHEGAPLPDALRRFPAAFPPDYAAQVEFATAANRLPEVLRQVESYHALRDRTRRHFVRLAVYCGIVTAACLTAMAAFLPLATLPKEVYGGLGAQELPAITRFWVWAGDHAAALLLSVPAAAAIAGAGLWILRALLSATRAEYVVPLWGAVQKSRDLATVCTALGLRLSAGGDTVVGLREAASGMRNRFLRAALGRVAGAVAEGRPLSDALYTERFFPRTLVWATSMGEASGYLGRVFRMFCGIYSAEMERGFETLNVLMTPLAMIALGNVAMIAVLSVMVPIFQLQVRLLY